MGQVKDLCVQKFIVDANANKISTLELEDLHFLADKTNIFLNVFRDTPHKNLQQLM